jgi:hypothetical protein
MGGVLSSVGVTGISPTRYMSNKEVYDDIESKIVFLNDFYANKVENLRKLNAITFGSKVLKQENGPLSLVSYTRDCFSFVERELLLILAREETDDSKDEVFDLITKRTILDYYNKQYQKVIDRVEELVGEDATFYIDAPSMQEQKKIDKSKEVETFRKNGLKLQQLNDLERLKCASILASFRGMYTDFGSTTVEEELSIEQRINYVLRILQNNENVATFSFDDDPELKE